MECRQGGEIHSMLATDRRVELKAARTGSPHRARADRPFFTARSDSFRPRPIEARSCPHVYRAIRPAAAAAAPGAPPRRVRLPSGSTWNVTIAPMDGERT